MSHAIRLLHHDGAALAGVGGWQAGDCQVRNPWRGDKNSPVRAAQGSDPRGSLAEHVTGQGDGTREVGPEPRVSIFVPRD